MAGLIKHPLQCSRLTHYVSIHASLLLKVIVGRWEESKIAHWGPHAFFFFLNREQNTFWQERTLLSFGILKLEGGGIHLWAGKVQPPVP